MNRYIPGTRIIWQNRDDVFEVFRPMIQATGGLSLNQICSITGLQSSTIQNWNKRGFIPRPENKKYFERHLARILLISALRKSMAIEQIGDLMHLVNGDTEDESDDLISEQGLYDYFAKAIAHLETLTLDDAQIEKTVEMLIAEEDPSIRPRLCQALKVMVYAYLVGHCLDEIDRHMQALKGV